MLRHAEGDPSEAKCDTSLRIHTTYLVDFFACNTCTRALPSASFIKDPIGWTLDLGPSRINLAVTITDHEVIIPGHSIDYASRPADDHLRGRPMLLKPLKMQRVVTGFALHA